MTNVLLKRFPNALPRPTVVKAEGCYLYLQDGRKILDATSGWCSQHVLGYSHPAVLGAMQEQMQRYCHVDSTNWENPSLEELATLLVSRSPRGLDKVYLCGTGGSEAVEAAMKLSYQYFCSKGKPEKTFFISREESFHGSTLQAIALSSIDIFSVYAPLLPKTFAKIPLHYPFRCMREKETLEEYAIRSAHDLETKIIEIGPERVCAFVGETMLGSLLGDVPPAPGYWQHIRRVCDKYDVQLILDEVYCGMGRSGRIYCCEWDGITPDYVCVSKALGGGYAPLSAVITQQKVEDAIKSGSGRVLSGHTYQGYALGCAVALAIQKIVHTDAMLGHINAIGEFMRKNLQEGLGDHPFFQEIHGRGSIFSLEYKTPDNSSFAAKLQMVLEEKYQVLVSSKWHRISFAIPFIMSKEEADRVTSAVIGAFKQEAQQWSRIA